MKMIKVYCYSVFTSDGAKSLDSVLLDLSSRSIGDRLIDCGGQNIRVDDIQKKSFSNGVDYWLLRLCKFRDDNWPGVSKATEASTDLDLDDDQVLSEETSILFTPATSRLVIQYNHYGVRASRIKEYFNICAGGAAPAYAFAPVLNNDALSKYNNKQIVTEIEAKIEGITPADVALLQGTGLEGALKQSVDADASTFQFSFSVDARVKKNKLQRGFIEKIVDKIKGRAGDNDSLSVTAKHAEEDAVETIDLLESRKYSEFKSNSIDRTTGRRYDPIQLYGLLEQTMKDWMATGG